MIKRLVDRYAYWMSGLLCSVSLILLMQSGQLSNSALADEDECDGTESGFGECCGGVWIDFGTSTDVCCGDEDDGVVYTPGGPEECCESNLSDGSDVIYRPGDNEGCCSGNVYDEDENEGCCDGIVYDEDLNEGCCNEDTVYDEDDDEKCCEKTDGTDDEVYDTCSQCCCGGELEDNTSPNTPPDCNNPTP